MANARLQIIFYNILILRSIFLLRQQLPWEAHKCIYRLWQHEKIFLINYFEVKILEHLKLILMKQFF